MLDRSFFLLQWQNNRARGALPCMLPIALCLAAGLIIHDPRVGMVAASGAFSVGFGSFQWLGASRVKPMLWATVGMALSTLGGSMVGHAGVWGTLFTAAWAGFGGGMLLALGPGAFWIGLQCGIFAIIAGGYQASASTSGLRAVLILIGGALQTAFIFGVWRFSGRRANPDVPDPFEGLGPALQTLRKNLTATSETFQYAVRQGVTLAVAAELARWLSLPNGYWVPMTALIVMKPAFSETFQRGLERVAGTILGAALAAFLASTLPMNLVVAGVLIVLFAYLSFTFINVHYGVFAIFLTAYIVFLLEFGGWGSALVVKQRAINTALGGGLALLSYGTLLFRSSRRESPRRSPVSGL